MGEKSHVFCNSNEISHVNHSINKLSKCENLIAENVNKYAHALRKKDM